MVAIDLVPVEAGTGLAVTCSFHRAEKAGANRRVVAMHHGILHSWAHFLALIKQLNERGVHVLMIDQQSEDSRWRNCIGLGSYVEGMAAAIRSFQEAYPEYEVTSYVFHSMGAAIGEQMQERYPDLRRPTVLMAPIPVQGATGVFVRLLLRRPFGMTRAILTLSVLSLVRRSEEVRRVFFDEHAGSSTVKGCCRHLKHSPFAAYLQLTLRYVLRFFRLQKHNEQPNLLLTSPTDYIFRSDGVVNEYRETEFFYRSGYHRADGTPWLQKAEIDGGHDFFLRHPDQVASEIVKFLELRDYFEIQRDVAPADKKRETAAAVANNRVHYFRIDSAHKTAGPRLHPLFVRNARLRNHRTGWKGRMR